MDSLTAKTQGSACLDVSTVEDCTLWDTRVRKIMLNIKGPIGKGYSALLLGRSSTTLTGLFVLPGVTDAEYEGVIQAMAWTPSPPVLVPKDTRIAQLILCKATVPQAQQCERRDRAFGSTGSPSVFWASTIATKRPILTLTLHHLTTDPLNAPVTVLMDKGADVTVIALKDWPSGWPLDSTAKGLMEVGGVSNTCQSKYMVTIKTHKGSAVCCPNSCQPPGERCDGAGQFHPELSRKFLIAAIDKRPLVKLTWKTEKPVWVDQWPLPAEKVAVLQELIKEQLKLGHITTTTSPWNSAIFVIKRKMEMATAP